MEQKITVKKIIECWDKTGIEGLKILLNEVKIFDNTWAHKIKTLIEKNHIESVNKEIELVSTRCLKCSAHFTSGEKSPNYKGGMRSKSGYLWIYKPNHHRAMKSGYVLNSVLVAEKTIGRKLLDTEIAHHIDKNKLNDKPENLKIMDRKEHKCLHATERWENGTFRN